MQSRVDKLLSLTEGSAAIIHKPENMRYLSGFLGEGALVIAEGVNTIITDFRYVEAAQQQSPGWKIVSVSTQQPQNACIAACLNEIGGVAFWEDDFLTIKQGQALLALLGDVEIFSLNNTPEKLRLIKDEGEIALMQKAANITDQAFDHILGFIKVGMTEKTIALELGAHMAKLGAEDVSFSVIAASGENASLPHAIPGQRKIQMGDVITMDFGCKVGGYCSDFTRTVAVGKIDAELQKIYQIVLDANLMALDGLKPGKTGIEVDAIARNYITEKGYGKFFGHGLGHGVGLEIHEEPRLSVTGGTVLESGMSITVEPGIYLPGLGGVRIEDLCILSDGGHINLCKSTKELITL